jgi:hypothetical protein
MMKRVALERFEALYGPVSDGDRLRLELLDALLDSALFFLDASRRASAAGHYKVAEIYREAASSTVDSMRALNDFHYDRPCRSVSRPFAAREGSDFYGDQN